MFFTREDIEKIHQGLLKLGIKDSELPETINVNSDDTLAVVQDGKNKKINIEEFFNNISLFKKEGFINITDRFNKHSISLIEAIQTVPTHQRIDGLVITFEDINGDWRIYQFRGDAVDFFDENKWTDLYDYTNYIVKSITPDEEDLTVSKPDKNGNAIVSLKDRVYDESNFSGKGYKILRKNIQTIDGVRKNILTQNMINKPNTIYEIRYDFTLGENITVPSNCILEFNGGSLRNGTVVGNNTYISSSIVTIFNNVTLSGTWNCKNIYAKWWVDKNNVLADSITAMTSGKGHYYIEFEPNITYSYQHTGNKLPTGANTVPRYIFFECATIDVNLNGSIHKIDTNDSVRYTIFEFRNCGYSIIHDGIIKGDRLTHDYTTISSSHEFGYGVSFNGKNNNISNVEIYDFIGDGIYIHDLRQNKTDIIWPVEHVNIYNCNIHHCRRQGITVSCTNKDANIIIEECNIHHIGSFDAIEGASPKSGIDIEPGGLGRECGNIIIKNSTITDCSRTSIIAISGSTNPMYINSLIIDNCYIEGALIVDTHELRINNSKIFHSIYYEEKFNHFLFNASNQNNSYIKNSNIKTNVNFSAIYLGINCIDTIFEDVTTESVGNFDSTIIRNNSNIKIILDRCKFKHFLGLQSTSYDFTTKGISGFGNNDGGINAVFKECEIEDCSALFSYTKVPSFLKCTFIGGQYSYLNNCSQIKDCVFNNVERIGNFFQTKPCTFIRCQFNSDFTNESAYVKDILNMNDNTTHIMIDCIINVSLPTGLTFTTSTGSPFAIKCYNSYLKYNVPSTYKITSMIINNSCLLSTKSAFDGTNNNSTYEQIEYDGSIYNT